MNAIDPPRSGRWLRQRVVIAAVVAAASGPASGTALAQEAAPPDGASGRAPSLCQPACRSGYICLDGQCVSACNPACGPGQLCTASAECVPVGSPPAAFVSPWQPGASPPAASGSAGYPPFAPHNPPPVGLSMTRAPDRRDRGAHAHDGFFLRMQAGPGYFVYAPTPARTPSGVGFAFDLALGAALTPKLIVAGAFVMMVGKPVDRDPSYPTTFAGLLANAIYYLPGNFFLGAGAGIGSIVAEDVYASSEPVGAAGPGLVLKAEVGREWWISPQWAIGLAIRLHGTRAKERDAGPSAPVWNGGTTSLLLSATYN